MRGFRTEQTESLGEKALVADFFYLSCMVLKLVLEYESSVFEYEEFVFEYEESVLEYGRGGFLYELRII
jgi:hypothetical protein